MNDETLLALIQEVGALLPDSYGFVSDGGSLLAWHTAPPMPKGMVIYVGTTLPRGQLEIPVLVAEADTPETVRASIGLAVTLLRARARQLAAEMN